MLIVPCICALVLSGPGVTGQNQVILKFHPAIGKTYRFTMAMDMTMTMAMGQGKSNPPMKISTIVDMDMKAVSRSGVMTTMETKIGGAKATAPAGSPLANATKQMEQQMSGKTIRSQIDSHYNTLSVKGSGMDQMFNNMPMHFPQHPVKVGDTWTTSLNMGKMLGGLTGGMFKGDLPITFRLQRIGTGPTGPVANIQMKMDGTPIVNTGRQSMTMHMKADGVMTVEIASGMTIGQNTVISVDMSSDQMKMSQRLTESLKLK